jgi:outer membrane protein OmpA-like peptidoglycan-associated protein
MHRFGIIATGAFILASSPTIAQAGDVSVRTMIDQLVPKGAETSLNDGSGSVLTVQSVTKDEIVDRLSFSPSRSLQSSPKAAKLPLVKGQETELLEALRGMPSMQVAVAFQGASDALAPEAASLLSDLSQALASAKLANSRVVIGVHTNSVGSDEYNLDLSSLRAKAIVGILTSVHGISRDRLVPFGFGRTRDSTLPDAAADERIQIVNLGPAPDRPETPATTVVATPVLSAPPRPTIAQYARTPTAYYYYYVRTPPAYPYYYYASTPPTYPDYYYASTPPAYPRYARPQWADSPSYSSNVGRPPGVTGGQGNMGGGNMAAVASNGPSGQHGSIELAHGNMGGGGMGGGNVAGAESNGPSGQHGSFFHLAHGNIGGGPMGHNMGANLGGNMFNVGGFGFHHRSDRRLKRYIRRVGESKRGFVLYSFQYIWGGPFYVGVMAQDLLSTYPEAVSVGPDNYFVVDYSKLDFDMMTLAEWEASSHRAAAHMAPAGL